MRHGVLDVGEVVRVPLILTEREARDLEVGLLLRQRDVVVIARHAPGERHSREVDVAGPQLTDVERTDTQLPCSTLLTIDEGEARRAADIDLEGAEDEVRHLGGGLIEDERCLRGIL